MLVRSARRQSRPEVKWPIMGNSSSGYVNDGLNRVTGEMNNDMLTKNRAENGDSRYFSLYTKKGAFVPGAMTEGLFWLLIEISSIHSEKVIAALNEHLVLGYTRREVCERNSVSAGYLSLSLAKLLRVEIAAASLSTYYK